MDPPHHKIPGATTPQPTAAFNTTSTTHPMHHHKMMMMHMTFYWGKNAIVLFTGWPGNSSGMYTLALIFVFLLAVLVEWLSHSNLINSRRSNDVVSALFQTVPYAVRSGLAYMVMLALMSYNGGIFVAAVLGHAVGFFVCGSRVFGKDAEKHSGLSSMAC